MKKTKIIRPYRLQALIVLAAIITFAHAASAANVALHASVTASTADLPASHAVDGDMNTRWASAAGVDPSHITLDLGQAHDLSSVVIHWEAANADTYEIRGSNNNSTWTTLAGQSGGVFGNRTDTLTVTGSYRYVRMYGISRSAGNNWGYSIWEMEVYGAPAAANACSDICLEELSSHTLRARVSRGDVVDIHYTVNGGAQQNLRITQQDANGWYYDIGGLTSGDSVTVWFTIITNGVGESTSPQTHSFSGGSSSSSSSSSQSSSSSSDSSTSSSSSSEAAVCSPSCFDEINSSTLRARVTQGDIVDIHYTKNGGAQQNVRITHQDEHGWYFDFGGLVAGDSVTAWYTIITGGVGQSTAPETHVFAGGEGGSSSSSSSSNSSSSSSTSSSTSTSSSSTSSVSSSSSSVSLGNVVPLYHSGTPLEPAIQYRDGNKLITRISDRGRDRHAKEDHFQAYDHYLSFYWEDRSAAIEIVETQHSDGTATIRMNVETQFRLNDTEAENRWFYRGIGTVAEYCSNGTMNVIDDLHYYKEESHNCRTGEPIKAGDKLEFELSQFLDHSVPNGRSAYYGTTYLYIVGEGLVAWDVEPGTFNTAMFGGGTKDSFKIPEKAWLGGATTIHEVTSGETDNHFMQMATNLGYDNGQPFLLGRRVHHSSFINGIHDEKPLENPTFAPAVGKTGPRYMTESCAGCHERNGRAAPAPVGQALDKWVFKVADANGNPHPDLGRALQSKTIGNALSEGEVSIASWTEQNGLRFPSYQFSGVTPDRFSARIAPQLVGIGLLEAIPESAILSREDPSDADGDGISGIANRVIDPVTGDTRLGRFGWKAGTSSVKHQVASAFNIDMGVMTSVFPTPDCGSAQSDCSNGNAALDDEHLDHLVKYISLLGVRPQRDYDDAAVQRGDTLFTDIGCAGCHTPTFQTSEFHPLAELRGQTIHPYTDLLLHDMGPGLADTLGDGQASGSEWRTAPLWGLGLSACVTGGVTNPTGAQGDEICTPEHSYLHDGRARSIEEAILWHGGEGQASKDAYVALSSSQKQDLLRFLESL